MTALTSFPLNAFAPVGVGLSDAITRVASLAASLSGDRAERTEAWTSRLAETRPHGTIYDGFRIAALLGIYDEEVAQEASERIFRKEITVHVGSRSEMSRLFQRLGQALPAGTHPVEGYHLPAVADRPARIVLLDLFRNADGDPKTTSLRLVANALHEAVHLLRPAPPLPSEMLALAHDTALRLYYGDETSYRDILRYGVGAGFGDALLRFIHQAYQSA